LCTPPVRLAAAGGSLAARHALKLARRRASASAAT